MVAHVALHGQTSDASDGEDDANDDESDGSLFDLRFDDLTIPRTLTHNPHVVTEQQLHSIYMAYSPSDAGLVVLDTACARSVGGLDHMMTYQREIASRYGSSCWQIGGCETFTFGNCAAQVSREVRKVPGCIQQKPVVFSASTLPGHFPI